MRASERRDLNKSTLNSIRFAVRYTGHTVSAGTFQVM